MRRLLPSLIVALALASPAAAWAQAKIAYVDLQRAMTEVAEGKAALARLKGRFQQSQQRLDKEQAQLKERMEQLDKKSLAMDEETLRKQRAELQQEMMRVTNLYTQLQKELRDEEQKATSEIVGKLQGVIRQIAEKQGFTYVLEKNEAGVLVAPPADDLTNELVRAYDAKYKK